MKDKAYIKAVKAKMDAIDGGAGNALFKAKQSKPEIKLSRTNKRNKRDVLRRPSGDSGVFKNVEYGEATTSGDLETGKLDVPLKKKALKRPTPSIRLDRTT